MKLVIATGNPGKLREIRAIINDFPELDLEIETIAEKNFPEPDEPHNTFMGNAQHKAKHYAAQTGLVTLSEDSGLSVAALDGFPGVRTKEFVDGIGGLDNSFAKLQAMLNNKSDMHAYFTCATTIYFPENDLYVSAEAIINGQLCFPPRGGGGMGFDPIFIPEGYTETLAELGEKVKNIIGHRAKAVRAAMQGLQEYMQTTLKC